MTITDLLLLLIGPAGGTTIKAVGEAYDNRVEYGKRLFRQELSLEKIAPLVRGLEDVVVEAKVTHMNLKYPRRTWSTRKSNYSNKSGDEAWALIHGFPRKHTLSSMGIPSSYTVSAWYKDRLTKLKLTKTKVGQPNTERDQYEITVRGFGNREPVYALVG